MVSMPTFLGHRLVSLAILASSCLNYVSCQGSGAVPQPGRGSKTNKRQRARQTTTHQMQTCKRSTRGRRYMKPTWYKPQPTAKVSTKAHGQRLHKSQDPPSHDMCHLELTALQCWMGQGPQIFFQHSTGWIWEDQACTTLRPHTCWQAKRLSAHVLFFSAQYRTSRKCRA